MREVQPNRSDLQQRLRILPEGMTVSVDIRLLPVFSPEPNKHRTSPQITLTESMEVALIDFLPDNRNPDTSSNRSDSGYATFGLYSAELGDTLVKREMEEERNQELEAALRGATSHLQQVEEEDITGINPDRLRLRLDASDQRLERIDNERRAENNRLYIHFLAGYPEIGTDPAAPINHISIRKRILNPYKNIPSNNAA